MGDLLTRQVTECFGFQPDGSYSMRHLSVGHAEPLRAELSAFLTAIREDSVPAVTGEEGVASLDIAMRCLGGRGEIAPAAARKLAPRAAARRPHPLAPLLPPHDPTRANRAPCACLH